MNLTAALLVDIMVLLQVLWFVLKLSEGSIFNPALLWIGLHVYTVTFRLATLSAGLQTMDQAGIRSDREIVNAVLANDFALIGVAIAVAVAAAWHPRPNTRRKPPVQLDIGIGKLLSFIGIFVGIPALLLFGRSAGGSEAQALGDFGTTSYPVLLATSATQGALIYCVLGEFSLFRVLLLAALLGLAAVNQARGLFLLPVLMAILLYHTLQRRRWFSFKWIVAVVSLGVLWFALKPVAFAIATGEGIEAAINAGTNYFVDNATTGGGDQVFLDEEATYMAAADEVGARFYGSTILPVIYLPVPRFMFPQKPRLNEYAVSLTSAERPVLRDGMTPMLVGEAYINFGWLGCLLVPFLYLLIMMHAYQTCAADAITSARRWLYLVFLVSMIQVFRDGTVSLVVFPFVDLLTLSLWPLLSWAATRIAARPGYPNQTRLMAAAFSVKK